MLQSWFAAFDVTVAAEKDDWCWQMSQYSAAAQCCAMVGVEVSLAVQQTLAVVEAAVAKRRVTALARHSKMTFAAVFAVVAVVVATGEGCQLQPLVPRKPAPEPEHRR